MPEQRCYMPVLNACSFAIAFTLLALISSLTVILWIQLTSISSTQAPQKLISLNGFSSHFTLVGSINFSIIVSVVLQNSVTRL